MDEAGARRRRDWGVAVTALLALLAAAYTVGFALGWGGPDERARVTYALYLPLTFGPMVLADAVYLAAAGVMLVGLLAFPGRRRSRQEQARLAMDVGVVVAAAFVVVW